MELNVDLECDDALIEQRFDDKEVIWIICWMLLVGCVTAEDDRRKLRLCK